MRTNRQNIIDYFTSFDEGDNITVTIDFVELTEAMEEEFEQMAKNINTLSDELIRIHNKFDELNSSWWEEEDD